MPVDDKPSFLDRVTKNTVVDWVASNRGEAIMYSCGILASLAAYSGLPTVALMVVNKGLASQPEEKRPNTTIALLGLLENIMFLNNILRADSETIGKLAGLVSMNSLLAKVPESKLSNKAKHMIQASQVLLTTFSSLGAEAVPLSGRHLQQEVNTSVAICERLCGNGTLVGPSISPLFNTTIKGYENMNALLLGNKTSSFPQRNVCFPIVKLMIP